MLQRRLIFIWTLLGHIVTVRAAAREEQQPDQKKLSFRTHPHRLARHWHRRRRLLPANYEHWTIIGSTPAFYACPACHDQLQAEHAAIQSAIAHQFPDVIVLHASTKLVNAIYLQVPSPALEADNEPASTLSGALQHLPGVDHVYASHEYQLTNTTSAALQIGAQPVAGTQCWTGQGVRVALLDSGLDYTHARLGGPGTESAYSVAYGDGPASVNNTLANAYFPNARIVGGTDLVGDQLRSGDLASMAAPDANPIDQPQGHGTLVADALLSIAPNVQVIAIKNCLQDYSCPEFALIQALEYVLDPNNDGDTSDKVRIVNISMRAVFVSSAYNVLAVAVQGLVQNGVLPVISIGNEDNIPYIAGGLSTAPHALIVGATELDATASASTIHMAGYSSRGPGTRNLIKPDLVAPGGPLSLARAGSGTDTGKVQGTSFASPLITAIAAMLQQKCPDCSPMSLRAMLMNTADPQVYYPKNSMSVNELAPVSWQGAGAVRVDRALASTFWAYSDEDMQPSLSLGVINAAADQAITRTIRVENLSASAKTLAVSARFRDATKAESGAVTMTVEPFTVHFASCDDSKAAVQIKFAINASLAPTNQMYQGGLAGYDPDGLDANEFDGWIALTDAASEQEISLPFHLILRQAANVTVANNVYPTDAVEPFLFDIGLTNHGAGTAQVDVYELLYVGPDKPELPPVRGSPPSNIRYVGYRTVPTDSSNSCDYVVEFAVQFWEWFETLNAQNINVGIDIDNDDIADLSLLNTGLISLGQPSNEGRIYDQVSETLTCTGFPVDHGSNSGTVVVHACSNDFGLTEPGTYSIQVDTFSFPLSSAAKDSTGKLRVLFPSPRLSVPPYDVAFGQHLRSIPVDVAIDGQPPLGMLVITNGHRAATGAGAAIFGTEALAITTDNVTVPEEITDDIINVLPPESSQGPTCPWENTVFGCSEAASVSFSFNETPDNTNADIAVSIGSFGVIKSAQETDDGGFTLECVLQNVPQLELGTFPPDTAPPFSPFPSSSPSLAPSMTTESTAVDSRSGALTDIAASLYGWVASALIALFV